MVQTKDASMKASPTATAQTPEERRFDVTPDRDGVSVEPTGQGHTSLEAALGVAVDDYGSQPCTLWGRTEAGSWERLCGPGYVLPGDDDVEAPQCTD